MKKIIRCSQCSRCACIMECGFTGCLRFYCADTKCYVDSDDGCTFGCTGKPMTGTEHINVYDITQAKQSIVDDEGW